MLSSTSIKSVHSYKTHTHTLSQMAGKESQLTVGLSSFTMLKEPLKKHNQLNMLFIKQGSCVCCFCMMILLLQSIILGENLSGSRQPMQPVKNIQTAPQDLFIAVSFYTFNPPLCVSGHLTSLCSWLGVIVKILVPHTCFHGLHANGLPEVSDDSQSISVGESAHRSAVHLQEHLPAAGEPPGVTDQRFRSYVSEVGELSVLGAASDLHHRDQLPGSPPRHGALLHFGGPVLLLFQGFGHCCRETPPKLSPNVL